jgi:hypothetical protein
MNNPGLDNILDATQPQIIGTASIEQKSSPSTQFEKPISAQQKESIIGLDPVNQGNIGIVPLAVFVPETDSEEPDTRSVYQKFMTRLNKLESDARIQGLYMEEQSRMLKDILSKIQIQQTQIFVFVNHLNETVLSLVGLLSPNFGPPEDLLQYH